MNKLIPGAKLSVRSAREQRLRAKIRGEIDDVDFRRLDNLWDRAADGFRRYDPTGRKFRALFKEMESAGRKRRSEKRS